ncbi:MAG: N-formylglutamate amidohydrolase [Methanomicrobiales archaeon]|nr:N-formylglutamate amidohydrolase [Methanomicrobiales archaeon]
MNRIPFLISIPHGGVEVPEEIRGRVALTAEDLLYYSDPCTLEIFDLFRMAEVVTAASISRLIVDLNRPPYHLPPAHPDGVVKTCTVDGRAVYREGRFPDPPLVHRMLLRHYFPFHDGIDRSLDTGRIRLGIDCHTMLPVGPPSHRDAGKKRPLICLGNNGDAEGNPLPGKLTTCPPEWLQAVSREFAREFPDPGAVRLNDPFAGGFVSLMHFWRRGTPWIQIEVNRALYGAAVPGGAPAPGSPRLRELRDLIEGVLLGFWEGAGNTPDPRAGNDRRPNR